MKLPMSETVTTPALSEYSGAALAYLGDAVMEYRKTD